MRNRKGFTLLELIISITILSMVILLISSGYRLALDSWEKGENETAATQRLRILSSLLSQQLKSAYPYRAKIEGKRVVLFRGDAASVMFATALTDSSYGGFKWVKYSYDNGTLLYKEGLLPDKKLTEKLSGDEEIIDTDLGGVEFSYFSADEGEWKESWDFGTDLPGAVRVRISYFQPFTINIPMGYKEDGENS
ncbi:MAG: prepilin-type N-terminal cleavage/methylation domain-containing protein [Deferribacteres bacterium]|nr:prepilin-type N-terminal cleavage/methylation domain-containing protein [Deferribacteres bacterium]